MSDNQKHPYHLVDPSPWPLVTAMSLLVLAYGFVLFMHDEKNNHVCYWKCGTYFI